MNDTIGLTLIGLMLIGLLYYIQRWFIIGATYSQKYKHILEEFVSYCNEQSRISRADHLESLLISFLHSKVERYN